MGDPPERAAQAGAPPAPDQRTRRLTAAVAAAGACAALLAACGSGGHLRIGGSPAAPVELSVSLGSSGVAVSPGHVGAGQVLLDIANQTARSSFLTVVRHDGRRPRSGFGPIGAMSSSQTKLALSPGAYVVAARGLRSARLEVGPQRAGGENSLLQP